MKLSIIIVNFNVKYFLEQALLSVRKASKGLAVETFVVDNDSSDESVDMIHKKFPEVTLIANKENVGFSTANNQAIRVAKGEYVLLLNPDTVVEEDTFSKCIDFMDAHPKSGGLGVKMIDGSGRFLPESKRGLPSPFVAFCKTFGLSKIFPKSKTFNRYHLGFLSKDETNEVDVLSGAFMMLRKSVLDEIGLLDERYFMYGEDIDLSYRIIKAGYKNYYFADTTIIHYKGESTKKGSLNYVRTFYNAMIIFAKTHFKGEQAALYIVLLQIGIYFRAIVTMFSNLFKRLALPLLDILVIFVGLYLVKDFWATHYFNDPNYYLPSFTYFNIPLYTMIWILSIFFVGNYNDYSNLRKLSKGVILGTLFLAAVYGFLDLAYRPSRAVIILGAIWTIFSTMFVRTLLHFFKYKNFSIGREKIKNLILVGSIKESVRVQNLIQQAQVHKNIIGTVSPNHIEDASIYLSNLEYLDEIVQIYDVNEIIFCGEDLSSQNIMKWMTQLGPDVEYRIVPEESLSIIGSSSKNTAGELYTIDIQFNIANLENRRNKRFLDIVTAWLFLLFSPIVIFFVSNKGNFINNIFQVFTGQKSWVGYKMNADNLPKIKEGVLTSLDILKVKSVKDYTAERLDFLYAKDYQVSKDFEIILKSIKNLGRK